MSEPDSSLTTRSLIEKLEALRKPMTDLRSKEAHFNAGLYTTIEIIKGDASTRKDEEGISTASVSVHVSEADGTSPAKHTSALPNHTTSANSPARCEIPVLEAITQAIQQARMDYDANSEDFNGRLDDTDLVAYVHDAIHPYLRTTEPVSGCHAVLDNMYGALKTIMALAENEDDEAYRIAKQAISEAEMKHAD